MSYIDGFVIAVPTANKDNFVAHANKGDSVFLDFGATRVVENWDADVPPERPPTSSARSRPRTTRRSSSA